MAGFVVVAVVMRPVGGWLSDRFGPVPVLAGGYAVVVVGAAHRRHPPDPRARRHRRVPGDGRWRWAPARGATFALIAKVTDPSRVGGVTGLVGAAGGLGGFVPPLIMGYVYGRTDSYAIGLLAARRDRGLDAAADPDRRAPDQRVRHDEAARPSHDDLPQDRHRRTASSCAPPTATGDIVVSRAWTAR